MHTIFQLHIISHLWGGGGEASITDNHIESNPSTLSIHINEASHHTNKQAPNTNQTPFCFHILTDGISQDTKAKLKDFERELNKTYPCQFCIYTLLDSDFQGLPKLNGNYLAYFRLKMASHLPQEITTCLYLDVDMLCVSDIRSIFDIDLGDKVCAVVLDADYQPHRIMEGRHSERGYVLNVETYFNSGFMLVNLAQWRKENVEQQCFAWMSKYAPRWYDQDVLNALLSDKIHILPLEWNFMIGHVENRAKESFKGEGESYSIVYSYEEYLRAKEKIKILHYLTERKPWHSPDVNGRVVEYPYRAFWWEVAFKTPIFYKDLQLLYMQLQEQMLANCLNLQAEILAKHTYEIYYLRKPHKRILNTIKRLLGRLKGKNS